MNEQDRWARMTIKTLERHRVKPTELAYLAGVAPGTIQRWLKGQRNIGVHILEKIETAREYIRRTPKAELRRKIDRVRPKR